MRKKSIAEKTLTPAPEPSPDFSDMPRISEQEREIIDRSMPQAPKRLTFWPRAALYLGVLLGILVFFYLCAVFVLWRFPGLPGTPAVWRFGLLVLCLIAVWLAIIVVD